MGRKIAAAVMVMKKVLMKCFLLWVEAQLIKVVSDDRKNKFR